MKKHRLLSLFTSLVMFASLASCAVPETINASKSLPAPEPKSAAETSIVKTETEDSSKLLINKEYEHTTSTLSFSWNEIEEVSKYEVQLKKDDDWRFEGTTRTPEYTLKHLDQDTEYEIRVVAKFGFFDKKENIISESIVLKTDAIEVETVQVEMINEYTATDEAIRLNWKKVEIKSDVSSLLKGDIDYKVEKKIKDEWKLVGEYCSDTTYRVTNLKPDTTYEFRVTPVSLYKDERVEFIPSEPFIAKTKPSKYEGQELIKFYYNGDSDLFHTDKNCSLLNRGESPDIHWLLLYEVPKNKKPCHLCAGGTAPSTTTQQTENKTVTSFEPTPYTGMVILNTSTKVYHFPGCSDIERISPENYAESNGIPEGYRGCGHCT